MLERKKAKQAAKKELKDAKANVKATEKAWDDTYKSELKRLKVKYKEQHKNDNVLKKGWDWYTNQAELNAKAKIITGQSKAAKDAAVAADEAKKKLKSLKHGDDLADLYSNTIYGVYRSGKTATESYLKRFS